GLVKYRAESRGSGLGFTTANVDDRLSIVLDRAATPVGQVHVMKFPAHGAQLQQRSRHEELDVIRMRSNGKDARHGWESDECETMNETLHRSAFIIHCYLLSAGFL